VCRVCVPPAPRSAFLALRNVSDALAAFLGVPPGSALSSSDVTRRVCAHARERGLLEGQRIVLDDALRFLQPAPGADVTVLNLQAYLRPHLAPIAA
jgi:predicted GNAT family N-acyltransferase